jgi:hypothetical protein
LRSQRLPFEQGQWDGWLRRHENSATSALSTIGDVVVLGSVAAAVVTRRVRIGVIGVPAGFAVGAIAHLVQPGTLQEEVVENLRHPLWAARAEFQRVFGRRG